MMRLNHALAERMSSMGKENNLDLVRFIIAAFVMYFHAFHIAGGEHSHELLRVILFFFISGFFVYGSFERWGNVKDFVLARCVRLFPGMIVLMFVTLFFIGPIVTEKSIMSYMTDTKTWEYLLGVTIVFLQQELPGVFTNNPYPNVVNGSLWTLQLELVYYASIVILSLLQLTKPRVLIVLFAFTYFLHHLSLPVGETYISLYRVFLLGMLFYVYKENIPIRHAYAFGSFIVLLVFWNHPWFHELFIFFGSYLTLYAIYVRKLTIPWSRLLGNCSYGVFLFGYPVQQSVQHFLPQISAGQNFIISLPFACLFALLSWFFVERKVFHYYKSDQLRTHKTANSRVEQPMLK
ncbi:acetyltransferase [Geomicrobium sp. JCM 19037]|nr:acetyltransferase [Geomicrobium sp. JCM 19037]